MTRDRRLFTPSSASVVDRDMQIITRRSRCPFGRPTLHCSAGACWLCSARFEFHIVAYHGISWHMLPFLSDAIPYQCKILLAHHFPLRQPYAPTLFPAQSGMVTPAFRFRLTSISPHWSSHSFPAVSNLIFQGSSNASNQK